MQSTYVPFLMKRMPFGPNQYAYMKGRGARDALALLAMAWLRALTIGSKVPVSCSDVSGAFDRVSLERLVNKLRTHKVHPQLIKLLASWLRQRFAYVILGGEGSERIDLRNIVF